LRDTGRVLLDVNTNNALHDNIRQVIESDADSKIVDLHVWRVGPGHFAAIISVVTSQQHHPRHYKRLLENIHELYHVTVEVNPAL
jgi:Co/Zn/Cd efflux system component